MFIKIKEMNGKYATAGYFFADGCKINTSEYAQVKDGDTHLASGCVEQITKELAEQQGLKLVKEGTEQVGFQQRAVDGEIIEQPVVRSVSVE
tara:strand:- start:1966 stop:2241 length:276 start_codon:yes stop_codon:yes gene_type:complete